MLVIKGVNLTKTVVTVALLVLLVILPLRLSDYYVWVLIHVVMWVPLAVAWDFFSGYTKYISLGSAAFFGLGLYVTAWVMEAYPALPLPVVVLFASLVNLALALVVGLVTLRLRGIYFAILTFSVSMVISNLIAWWEATATHTRGTYPPLFTIQAAYYTMLIGGVVVLLSTALLRRSKFGLALKMIGENEEAAIHVGVNASMYKTLGFAISAMLMGFIGGCFVTATYGYFNTDTAFAASYSFYPPVMALLGGIGTVYGPVLGATFLSLLQDYLTASLTSYFMIALGLILIFVVMFMPNGIMGVIGEIRRKGLSQYLRDLGGSIIRILKSIGKFFGDIGKEISKLLGRGKEAREKPAKAAERGKPA